VTGVTYIAVAMTLVGKVLTTQGSNDRWVYLWVLVAPATGTNNVVITASSATSLWGVAAEYTGASQTGQPDASATEAHGEKSLATVAHNCWGVGIMRSASPIQSSTAPSGSVVVINAAGGRILFFDTGGPVPPSTPVKTIGAPSGVVMATFKPA
jgi:hypothetical protein